MQSLIFVIGHPLGSCIQLCSVRRFHFIFPDACDPWQQHLLREACQKLFETHFFSSNYHQVLNRFVQRVHYLCLKILFLHASRAVLSSPRNLFCALELVMNNAHMLLNGRYFHSGNMAASALLLVIAGGLDGFPVLAINKWPSHDVVCI